MTNLGEQAEKAGMTKGGSQWVLLDVLIRRHLIGTKAVLWVEGAGRGPDRKYGW
jgi:hypothetical protein